MGRLFTCTFGIGLRHTSTPGDDLCGQRLGSCLQAACCAGRRVWSTDASWDVGSTVCLAAGTEEGSRTKARVLFNSHLRHSWTKPVPNKPHGFCGL